MSCCTFLSSFQVSWAEADTIEWARYQFPPVHILRGPDKNLGFADKMHFFLQEQMPGFTHKDFQAPVIRIVNEMKSGRDLCAMLLWTKERERYLVFSNPVIHTGAHRVFIPKNKLNQWKDIASIWVGDTLSVEKTLIHRADLRLGVVPGRSYGIALDSLISRHINELDLRSGTAPTGRLVKMLSANRIDYIIEYQWLLNYQSKKEKFLENFIGIPIVEDKDKLSGRIACTRNTQGKRVIDKVNSLMVEKKDTFQEFQKSQDQWLGM